MIKKIFAMLIIANMLCLMLVFTMLMLADTTFSLPIRVESKTEIAVVRDKIPETTVLISRGERMLATSDRDLYENVEVGEKVVIVRKRYQRLLGGETLETLRIERRG